MPGIYGVSYKLHERLVHQSLLTCTLVAPPRCFIHHASLLRSIIPEPHYKHFVQFVVDDTILVLVPMARTSTRLPRGRGWSSPA